jgi:hypothetical protein
MRDVIVMVRCGVVMIVGIVRRSLEVKVRALEVLNKAR